MLESKTYSQMYHEKHREELNRKNKEWRLENREILRKKKQEHYQKNRLYYNAKAKVWRKDHPNYSKEKARKLRLRVLNFLGNSCANCGNSDTRTLQIDHLNGGGSPERKKLGTSGVYLRILKLPQEQAKEHYQILCANCNAIKEFEIYDGTTIGRKPARA